MGDSGKKKPDAVIRSIERLREQQRPYREISRRLGVSTFTVYKYGKKKP